MKSLALSILLAFPLVTACSDDPVHHTDADASDASDVTDTVEDATPDADAEPDTTLAPLTLGQPVPAGRVIAGIATRPDQLVGGPKAEGMLGDLVLANTRATFVVEGARKAGGLSLIHI